MSVSYMAAPPGQIDFIIASLRDTTYPIPTLITEAIRHSQKVVLTAFNDDKARLSDTLGVKSFFWSLWERIFTLAEEDVTTHDRSIAFIKGVKMSRAADTASSRWKIRGAPGGWSHLPLLFAVAQEGWDTRERSSSPVQFVLEGGKPGRKNRVTRTAGAAAARAQYLNSQRFIARIWVEAGIDVSSFAEKTLRAALKKGSEENATADADESFDEDADLSMTSISSQARGLRLDELDVDSDGSDDEYNPDTASNTESEDEVADIDDVEISDAPAGLELEAALIWLSIAGKQIYKQKEGKQKWPALWQLFNDAANDGGRTAAVIDAAKAMLSSLDRFNIRTMLVKPIKSKSPAPVVVDSMVVAKKLVWMDTYYTGGMSMALYLCGRL
ncbi:hypothetical protein M422DRAFT_251684 [Sphaerobolus stellatus SS14]|uniref:Uncharacterized protein n=1 Tax=Sphaerobolus stellatus (strain SS14) TaxID=990650 RepID=A0A0C9W0Q9_SPHS4|nr:hypothetical protein M422DRAFT_251684 [Sphaerobolus stellatus SS14]